MSYLQLTDISKKFGGTVAVKNFNLNIDKGEFVSFLGPSGCGKTTTLRMIAGFELPTTGNVILDGEDITYQSPNQRNVGMVFQSYALFPNLTVAQNIGFGLKVKKTPNKEIDQRTDEMLNLIHLEEYGKRYPYQLSGGQQQRIALARAIAIRPRVLLLDEPLSALDAKIRVELRLEIRRIQQQLGITTVYVTHDQEEALSLSDRVVVMSQGLIEQVGTPLDIYNFPTSEFVAAFVGQLNMLPVRIDPDNNEKCWVADQSVLVRARLDRSQSENGRLAIRPEELNIGYTEKYNNLQGVVENLIFLGAIVRIHIKIGDSKLSMDIFNERDNVLPRIGDKIIVNFPKDACWIM